MPYSPNANWNAATALAAQQPVYYIAIEGLTAYHFSTAPVRSASVTKKPYLHVPSGIGQKVSQLQGRTSLNLFNLQLTNRNGEINDLFATEAASPTLASLINRRVTLYAGYAELSEADYAPWAQGRIRSMRNLAEGTLWEFAITDLRRAQLETICINADARGSQVQLAFAADTAAGAGLIVTNGDPSGWSQGDRIFLGPSTDAGNPGAEEKVTVQQVRNVTNQVFIDPPLTFNYKAGDAIRTASTVLQGSPYNILLALLTGDFANGSWPLDLALGLPTGLGIDPADIDVASIQKERDRSRVGWIMRFDIARPTGGSSFIEANIYRWLGYPRILLNGKISFRAFRAPYSDDVITGLATLTEADIIDWESDRDVDSHVNRVVLGVDTALGGGQPAQIVTSEDTADQALTEEQAEEREDSTGFIGASAGIRHAASAGSVFLRRFLDGPWQVRLHCHRTKRALEVGEDVLLTHSRIPNPASATPGVSARRMEIVERNEDLAGGRVELVLQDANFTRPWIIGPPGGLPLYDSASASDKEHFYIGPSGGGNFGDGLPTYEIC
jgi:hypothetical protein